MSLTHADATHAFCEMCDDIVDAIFEPLKVESKDGWFVGGDIICHECKGVIATLYKETVE